MLLWQQNIKYIVIHKIALFVLIVWIISNTLCDVKHIDGKNTQNTKHYVI